MSGTSTVIRCPIIVDDKAKNFLISIALESTSIIVNMNNLIKHEKCLIKDICSYLESKDNRGPIGTLTIKGDDHGGFYREDIACYYDEVQDILKNYSGADEYVFTIKDVI